MAATLITPMTAEIQNLRISQGWMATSAPSAIRLPCHVYLPSPRNRAPSKAIVMTHDAGAGPSGGYPTGPRERALHDRALASRKPPEPLDRQAARAELDALIERAGMAGA